MWRNERKRNYSLKRCWRKVKQGLKAKEEIKKGWKRGGKFNNFLKIRAYINAWGSSIKKG